MSKTVNYRSLQAAYWVTEHYLVHQMMVQGEISGLTANILLNYIGQELAWQCQAERAKDKRTMSKAMQTAWNRYRFRYDEFQQGVSAIYLGNNP